MGLDMYLEKFPRVEGLSVIELRAIQEYAEYTAYLEKADGEDKCTFKQWCGELSENLPEISIVNQVKNNYLYVGYSEWDTNHKFPHYYYRGEKEVGYWRKANAIHSWFVQNVQNGEDDCTYHREVTISDLEQLKKACINVLESLNLENGKVYNGTVYDKDGEHKEYVDGKVATNIDVAEELLPTASGFFFGGTDYDEYYVRDLQHTIEVVDDALNDTDFNTEMLYYCSSW